MIISSLDDDTRRVLSKVFFDVIILGCLEVVIDVLYYADSFKRGFFCGDESLMHPYHESTVGYSLGIVGFGLPVAVIIIIEVMRWKLGVDNEDNRAVKLFNRDISNWLVNIYKNVGLFIFGLFVNTVITDVGKHVLGRLRPHFMSVCQPIMPDGSNCSDPSNMHRYIEEFTCSNAESSAELLNQARKSFPSGHSSISVYAMIFTALYLHRRMTWKGSKLLKPLLQFSFVTIAWFTALSRISDYKHHWSDVLAGSILGVSVSLFTVFGVSDLFKNQPQIRELPLSHSSAMQSNIN